MRLPFDLLSQNYIKPKLYLCEVDKTKICELETIGLQGSFKFNAYSELSCTISRTYTNMTTGETQVNPFYDKIEALRLLFLEGFGYFEIQDPEIVSDGIGEKKNITAYGLEYRLSQKYLENFKINTGEADSLEVVEAAGSRVIPITLVNQVNKNLSLSDLALEKIYDWTWGHIDDSLKTMSRQFEISRASVYDFIVKDICEKFNCYAIFDTIDNKINLYAESLISKHIGDGTSNTFVVSPPYSSVGTVSIDSYKTTKYTYDPETGYLVFNEPPENGAKIEITDGSQEKWQTDVYVTFDNLAQEVNVSYSAEDIKTVLTVKGQDDLDIREVNMGLPYIVDISYYYTVDWMGQDLYDAYTKYLRVCNASQSQYAENSEKMIELSGQITYEQQRLSLQYSIAENVTSTTVGTYYVRGGTAPNYYYKEVKLPDEYSANVEHYYMLSGTDLNEDKVSKLYAALQTYYVSGSTKDVSEITKIKDSFAFMETNTIDNLINVLSSAPDLKTKNTAVLSFLDEMWDQIGQNPLDSLYLQAYKKIETTNTEAGWNETTNENYWRYYPVTLIIRSIEKDIKDRKAIIATYQEEYSVLQKDNNKIANSASIYNNFTHEQLVRLSPFLREDEYTDDNFLETDSDTIETLMKTKQELLECGKIELSKLCEPKLSFSMDMANIYALHEFEPIVHQFQLGNLINVVIRPDYIKKARLLAVDINFDDFSDFSCEFGELTSIKTQSSIHADLLANALTAGSSVASNQSYWDKGADLATSTDIKIQNGLLGAIDGIYNADKSVLIDNHGILLRQVLDNGEYSPYQLWLTNNNILVSTDAFDTAQTGIGVFEVDGREMYGVLAKAVLAGYIEGSTIVGGTIDIGNGTFTVDSNGHMIATSGSIAGWTINKSNLMKEITLDNTDYQMYLQAPNGDSMINAFAVRSKESDSDTWDTQFAVNYKGKMLAKNADVTGSITATSLTLGSGVTIPYSKLSGTPDLDIYIAKDGTIGSTPASGSTGFKVSSNGLLQASNAVIYGTVYASAGEIGGWTVYPELLRKEVTVDDVTYQMYMQPADGVNTTNAFAVRKKNADDTSWNTQFSVNYAGKMTAKNANITGTITATDGSIAGYNIGPGGSYDNAIYKRVSGDDADYEVGLKATSGDTDLAFYVKESIDNWGSSSNTFYVRNNGQLYAQKADITGKITASSGAIGSWTIGDMGSYTDSIYSTYCAASSPSSSNPEYAVFMRGKGAENTLAFGVKKRTSSSTSWNDADNPFYVRKDGYVKMSNADVTGTITADDGNIGGFYINSKRLICRQNNSDTDASLAYMSFNAYSYDTDNHNAIIIGTRSSASDDYTTQFRVRYDGSVYMRNATITGDSTIAAACIPNLSASKITSGTISTDRLSSSVITTSNFSSKSLTTGNLTVTSGSTLGHWTVTSSGGLTCGSGTSSVGLSSSGVSHGSGWTATWYDIIQAGNSASDERLKADISEFDNDYDSIFNNLKPVKFRYNIDPERLRLGFIAQDVKENFESAGISNFGGVYVGEGEDQYYRLLKEDFIALNTWQIQKLKARVEELETRLAAIEA